MIKIIKHSALYTLKVKQLLPITIQEAWDFFSNPENLKEITPLAMNFQITSIPTRQIYAGQLITYKVNITSLFKSNWITEITQVTNNKYFVDEQRFGPYKLWHHEHHFKSVGLQTEVTDIVTYKIPMGLIGNLFHYFFIKNKLTYIFSFRKNKLKKLFPGE